MVPLVFRYQFVPSVPADDVEVALALALLGTESLHGECQTRLEVGHTWDAPTRTCVIDATTEVGLTFNRLFLGFVNRECGPGAFRVTPIKVQHALAGEVG